MSEKSMEEREQRVDDIMRSSDYIVTDCFGCCTVVMIKLPNGFTMVEKSACVDPDDYDHDLGVELCCKKLRAKVLELEAYYEMQHHYLHSHPTMAPQHVDEAKVTPEYSNAEPAPSRVKKGA